MTREILVRHVLEMTPASGEAVAVSLTTHMKVLDAISGAVREGFYRSRQEHADLAQLLKALLPSITESSERLGALIGRTQANFDLLFDELTKIRNDYAGVQAQLRQLEDQIVARTSLPAVITIVPATEPTDLPRAPAVTIEAPARTPAVRAKTSTQASCWNDERDACIMRMRDEPGWSWKKITAAVNKVPGPRPVGSEAAVQTRYWQTLVPRFRAAKMALAEEQRSRPQVEPAVTPIASVHVDHVVERPFAAVPPDLATRDGSLSLAALEERANGIDARGEPIDRVAFEDWARKNRIIRASDEGDVAFLRRVNVRRVAEGLPRWRLARTFGPHEPLPVPGIGKEYGRE